MQREVPLRCALPAVLPAHHLEGMSQAKIILCLGVTLRIFANQSKNKGFRDKTCSSTSTIVGN